MTTKEIEHFEEKIFELIFKNKKGVSIDVIIEYLDYINKCAYSEEQINPILNKLLSQSKISCENSTYFPVI